MVLSVKGIRLLNKMYSTYALVGVPAALMIYLFWRRFNKKCYDVKDKVILITGASSGLGKALAKVLYVKGAKIIIAARNIDALHQVKNELLEIKVSDVTYVPEVLQLDLEDLSGISSVVTQALEIHGHVDILVNNAGMSYRGEISDTSLDVHQRLMTVNYFGHVALTKELLPSMVKRKSGQIVAISSIQGKLSIPFRSAYSASKHATQAFFDCLRAEVAKDNIHVSIVSPGYISTNLSLNALTGSGNQYGVMDETTKKGMTPENVAEQVLQTIECKYTDIMVAPTAHKLAVLLRPILPNVISFIMTMRAKKQRKIEKKSS